MGVPAITIARQPLKRVLSSLYKEETRVKTKQTLMAALVAVASVTSAQAQCLTDAQAADLVANYVAKTPAANPENLTDNQRAKLEWIATTDPRLHRAYLLKEGLRTVFALKGEPGKQALDQWISWARRCRIPAFVKLQRSIVRHRAAIDATLDHGLSNALIESTNTKIRLITRVAFGFHSAKPLIALAMLTLGTHRPALPGRH